MSFSSSNLPTLDWGYGNLLRVAVTGAVTATTLGSPIAAPDAFANSSNASEAVGPTRVLEVGSTQSSSLNEDFRDIVRRAEFLNVHGAIGMLASLPDDADFYIEPDTQKDGEYALSLMYMLGVRVPKVFTHDSESIAFSWERDGRRYYATVSDGGVGITVADSEMTSLLGFSSLQDASVMGLFLAVGEHVGGSERATG